jgi:retinal rod rhodopsin-sensitive cGMP 3',5'-cyclic phosphodiesterase subunit delta
MDDEEISSKIKSEIDTKQTSSSEDEEEEKDDDDDRRVRKRFSETEITCHEVSEEVPTRNMTDREWKESIARGDEGEIVLPPTREARAIMRGFRIVSMIMRDADSGEKIWETDDWGEERYAEETRADIPKEILDLKAVSREIKFSSVKKIDKFRIEQKLFLFAQCIEEWKFEFGFVMPGSTNSWQQTIHAADETLSPDILSGNLVLESSFYDAEKLISKSVLRLYYV